MIECPFCSKEVALVDNFCPECHYEILLDSRGHLMFKQLDEDEDSLIDSDVNNSNYENIEQLLIERFRCVKCEHRECSVRELAMTGTGLSKILDIQYNHYLFFSCQNCGYVEVYNPDILKNKEQGVLGTILDILF